MATSKLTISIETSTIENAKLYAKQQHVSLSKLIQKYLQSVSGKQEKVVDIKPKHEFSQWVQELMLAGHPTPDFDHKAEYHKHIEEKYGI